MREDRYKYIGDHSPPPGCTPSCSNRHPERIGRISVYQIPPPTSFQLTPISHQGHVPSPGEGYDVADNEGGHVLQGEGGSGLRL